MSRLGTESAFEDLGKAKAREAKGKEVVHLEVGAQDFTTHEQMVMERFKELQFFIFETKIGKRGR